MTLKVPGNINAGDRLTLTVRGVINPSGASSTYTIGLTGAVSGPSTAAAPFPHAAAAYPNGAIISFSGRDYVLAGGHAFEVTSSKIMAALQKVDHATVVAAAAGAKPPSGTPRQGTLLFTRPVNGAATIYVVGTDGELHGFVSPKQFKDNGYDPALVVTVPSLGGLKVGRSAGAVGAAGNAFGTSSDGAIIDSSGTYYVFAGGRAFLVPSSAELSAFAQGRQSPGALGPSDLRTGQRRDSWRRGTQRSRTGVHHVPGQPVPVQVDITAAFRRLRRDSCGPGPRHRRPVSRLELLRLMNTGQRYRAPVRWLSFALATVLCGAATCLPQTASALGRSAATTLAGAAAARTSTHRGCTAFRSIASAGSRPPLSLTRGVPGARWARPRYGCCTSVIGDSTERRTPAGSS